MSDETWYDRFNRDLLKLIREDDRDAKWVLNWDSDERWETACGEGTCSEFNTYIEVDYQAPREVRHWEFRGDMGSLMRRMVPND